MLFPHAEKWGGTRHPCSPPIDARDLLKEPIDHREVLTVRTYAPAEATERSVRQKRIPHQVS